MVQAILGAQNQTLYFLNPVTGVYAPVLTSPSLPSGLNIGGNQNSWGQIFSITESYPGLNSSSDPVRVQIGGFPPSDEYGNFANTGGYINNALTGAISIPAGAVTGTQYFDAGVAGYAQTSNTQRAAVGIYGEGGILVNGASAWGVNTEVINCENHNVNCGPGNGKNFTLFYGNESDVSLYKVGTTAPTGAAIGYIAVQYGETQPAGDDSAFEAQWLNALSGAIGWKYGFNTGDGAATIAGVSIGATALNSGSSTLNSQKIIMCGYNSGTQVCTGFYGNSAGATVVTNPLQILAATGNPTIELTNSTSAKTWNLLTDGSGNFEIFDTADRWQISASLMTVNVASSFNGIVAPGADNTYASGGLANRWSSVYSVQYYGGANVAGVTCSGTPTSSFAASGGIVTHC